MSSVSGVSSLLNQYQVNWQNNSKQVKQDFSDLMTSLRSGDLSGAQQACSTIIQDISTASQTQTTQQTGVTGIQGDLDALGQALQSGDVNAAQTAYTKLQQDFQIIHAHHHHQHHQVQGNRDQNTPTIMDPVQTNGGDSNSSSNSNNSSSFLAGIINLLA